VPMNSAPAAINGFGVIVATDDGRVSLLQHGLDSCRWEHRLSNFIYATPTFDRDNRRVVVCATDGLVASIALSGAVAWNVRLDAEIYAMPTIIAKHDLLVLALFGSTLVGLSLTTGEVRWRISVPRPWDANFSGPSSRREVYATPAHLDDRIIVIGGESVLCLSPDGRVVWTADIGTAVKASPVINADASAVLVGGTDGSVWLLDVHRGTKRASVNLGSRINASPAVSDGIALFGTTAGEVVGIDAGDELSVRWANRDLGGPYSYTSFVEATSGVACMTSNRGTVVGFRTRDGKFLWETSQQLGLPGHQPEVHTTPIVAADGHLYVASYTGDLYEFRFPVVSDSTNDERDRQWHGDGLASNGSIRS